MKFSVSRWWCEAVSLLLYLVLVSPTGLLAEKAFVKMSFEPPSEFPNAEAQFDGKSIGKNSDPIEIDLGKSYNVTLSGASDQEYETNLSHQLILHIETCDTIYGDKDALTFWVRADEVFYTQTKKITIGESPASPANDFGGEGQSGGGGCSACGPSAGSTSPTVEAPSVNLRSGLGRNSEGIPFGNIIFNQELQGGMITRANFLYQPFSVDAEATPVFDSGTTVLRQIYIASEEGGVLVPKGLVDFVDILGGGVELRFYEQGSFGAADGNGVHAITGDPIVIKKIEAASDAVAGSGIIYSISRDEIITTQQFYGQADPNGSSIKRSVDAKGVVTETTTNLTVDPLDPTLWTREVHTRRFVTENSSEIELSYRIDSYASRGFGEVLDQSVDDPNGAALLTSYAYYENEINDGSSFKKLKHRITPDGGWEKYIYNSEGNSSITLSPWKDAPIHPDDATESNCVAEYILYDGAGAVNGSGKKILGVQTGRQQTFVNLSDEEVFGGYTRYFITEETRSYHGESTDYLSNSSSYLPDYSTPEPSKGALFRTSGRDGVAKRVTEDKGNYNAANGTFNSFSEGVFTRRIQTQGTLSHPDGITNKTTRTISISDFKGTHREETQVFNGSTYETVAVKIFSYEPGDASRVESIRLDDDVISNTSYITDREVVDTDAFGVRNTTFLDAYGDIVLSVKEGVASGANYEAQSPITTTYATSGLTRTTTVSAATLTQSTTQVSDKVGRVVSRTDEQGRTFTTAFTNGGRTVTETRPGGVTVVTDYYRDGQIKSVTGSGAVAEYHDYALDENANVVHTVYIGTGDNTSPRWRKSATNGLDQLVYEITPGPNSNQIITTHHYNGFGQRVKSTKTGRADTLFAYDELGQLFRQGIDMNANGVLDLVSTDPISESISFFEKDGTGHWWSISQSRRHLSDTNTTDFAQIRRKSKLSMGSESETHITDERGNTTIEATTINREAKSITKSATSDLSNLTAIEFMVNGLLISRSSLTVANPFLYRYDALGRQVGEIDPRTDLEAVTSYNALGQIQNVINRAGDATTFAYYTPAEANAGAIASRTNGENETVRYAYDNLGRLTHQWGNGTYPITWGYNNFGEQNELKTFQAGGDWDSTNLPTSFGTAIPSTTTWNYHSASGVLLDKTDAENEAVTYSYYNNGLLNTRTWARGVVTTYAYDEAGRLTSLNYSDSTPSVSMNYRRDGQKISVQDASGSHIYAYHEGTGMIAGETVTTGVWDGVALAWPKDAKKRLGGFSAQIASKPLTAVSYGYDLQGRLNSVNEGDQEAVYGYTPSSNLLQTTTLKSSGATRLTGSKIYDSADRLESLTWSNGITAESGSNYTYDSAGRRTLANQTDGSYWSYGYNTKGEIDSAIKRDSNNAVFPGLSHGYQYDELGNRKRSTVDAAVGGTRDIIYSANVVNQYDSIQTPNSFDVTGSVESSADVKVNNHDVQRLGPYFRRELTTDNSIQPRWESIVIDATLTAAGLGGADIQTKREGQIYHPRATQALSYDEDGNLLNDGRWTYGWDAENRLVTMETALPAVSTGVPKLRLNFTYDAIGRRVGKSVSRWDILLEDWFVNDGRKFIYDGWNLVAEIEANNTTIVTNVWGLDLSQSLQAAGGVSGLLWANVSERSKSLLFTFDGVGNVTAIVDSIESLPLCNYEYGAFGNTVVEHWQGSRIHNPWRFSSKYQDSESGLIYYGYRYYSPEMGRWISRDPIGEGGGINLFGMVENDAVNNIDLLGLDDYALGYRDPVITHDAGAGAWGSTPATRQYTAIRQLLLENAQLSGWPNATKHLVHYLNNSGDTYTMNLQEMVKTVPTAQRWFDYELALAMQFAEKIGGSGGEIYSRKTATNGKVGPSIGQAESADWFYAVNGYSSWGKGRVVCPLDGSFEMIFEYKLEDQYNWDTGKSVSIDVPGYGPVEVTDHFMGELHRQGLAKEYKLIGSMKKKVVWKRGEAPVVTDLPTGGGGR